jgi:hypothetical protein
MKRHVLASSALVDVPRDLAAYRRSRPTDEMVDASFGIDLDILHLDVAQMAKIAELAT